MKKPKLIALTAGSALITALTFGCQNTGSTNTPATSQPVAQGPAGAAGPAGDSAPAARIVTDEPESYSATLRLTAETVGERRAALPHLEAEVARRGRDRRVSFRLPDGEQVVYLSRGRARYVILPDRRRYAEVTSREAGFELPRLLMPDQFVDYLQRQRGYERAGEEEMNGRTVVKYVASGETRTGTRAGGVASENVVYVDKMTELPLRAELVSEAEAAVQGVRGVKVVTEMRNLRAGADPGLFAVPRGMEKVKSEQVRRQINALSDTAAGIVGALLSQVSAAAMDEPASAAR